MQSGRTRNARQRNNAGLHFLPGSRAGRSSSPGFLVLSGRCARLVVVGILAALLLSGCLITRLYAFKQQFCDFDRNFSFSLAGDGVHFVLHDPVLRERDILRLAGSEPTRVEQREQARILTYIFERIPSGDEDRVAAADDLAGELTVDLFFRAADGPPELERVRLEDRFAFIAAPGRLDQHARNACHAQWRIFGLSGEIDLADADLSGLPTRDEVIEVMGPPVEMRDGGRTLIYVYRLRNSQPGARPYSFTLWYDAGGERLLRSRTRSIRITSTTDYIARKMRIETR